MTQPIGTSLSECDRTEWRTSGNFRFWQTENLKVCSATFGRTLSKVNENKFIHFALD